MSDTKTPTATATETAFDLTPPDPVPEVKPEKAAGLVPVSEEVKMTDYIIYTGRKETRDGGI